MQQNCTEHDGCVRVSVLCTQKYTLHVRRLDTEQRMRTKIVWASVCACPVGDFLFSRKSAINCNYVVCANEFSNEMFCCFWSCSVYAEIEARRKYLRKRRLLIRQKHIQLSGSHTKFVYQLNMYVLVHVHRINVRWLLNSSRSRSGGGCNSHICKIHRTNHQPLTIPSLSSSTSSFRCRYDTQNSFSCVQCGQITCFL